MKNQGISLISLIITIIVIIILAAIVIFSGMDTPERAQLSNFAQQVSNVHSAVIDQLTDVTVAHTASGETRNAEQLYYELATSGDCGQFGYMSGTGKPGTTSLDKEACQNITADKGAGRIKITLPKVRESDKAWYVTKDGKVFNATGFVSGGKTYFTADLYCDEEITLTSTNKDSDFVDVAKKIAGLLADGTTGAVTKVQLGISGS